MLLRQLYRCCKEKKKRKTRIVCFFIVFNVGDRKVFFFYRSCAVIGGGKIKCRSIHPLSILFKTPQKDPLVVCCWAMDNVVTNFKVYYRFLVSELICILIHNIKRADTYYTYLSYSWRFSGSKYRIVYPISARYFYYEPGFGKKVGDNRSFYFLFAGSEHLISNFAHLSFGFHVSSPNVFIVK